MGLHAKVIIDIALTIFAKMPFVNVRRRPMLYTIILQSIASPIYFEIFHHIDFEVDAQCVNIN